MNPLTERQWVADAVTLSQEPRLSHERLAASMQQAQLGRWLLEQCAKTPAYEVSCEQAVALQQNLASELSAEYQWLLDVDARELAAIMSEVSLFRHDFTAQQGSAPSGGRVYRHFRLNLEQATDEKMNEMAYQRVVVIEALLQGDITRGDLPF